MKKYSFTLLCLILMSISLVGCSDQSIVASDQNGGKSVNAVATKVDSMTLDEKVGQMVIVGIDGVFANSQAKKLIRRYHPGGIILYSKNIQNADQTVRLINQLKSVNADVDHSLPLFVSVDQEGGSVSRLPDEVINLPSNKEIGKMDDPELSYQVGRLLGKELHDFGFNMNFAPVVDINIHPGQSVIDDRSYGPDKKLVSKLGVAAMKGIESNHVIPVVKHFPGYGDVTVDAHTGLPKVDDRLDQLKQFEWVPFQKAINHGADAVMVTHMLLPKLDSRYPASMSQTIITDMLRNELGFNGVVITDDMTMSAIKNHYEIGKAAVQAVKAGSDIVLIAHNYNQQISVFQQLKQAVKDGEISEKQIDNSVHRIIELKRKYNLSDQQIDKVNVQQLNQKIKSVLDKDFPAIN